MNEFDKGETVILEVEIRNFTTNVLFDPTSISVTIVSTRGTVKVNDVAMTKTSTGVYTYSWTSDEEGVYKIVYKAVDGSKVTYKKDSFKILSI